MKNWISNRELMKSGFNSGVFSGEKSDQNQGLPQPPLEIETAAGADVFDLPDPQETELAKTDIRECIGMRKSRRKYSGKPISLAELSFMLWATQGLKKIVPAYSKTGTATLRTVPSAGARHPFETYLAVSNVTGLKPGIYRYSTLNHNLVFLFDVDKMAKMLTEATVNQSFTGKAPVVFLWSCKPYLGEWRYMGESHKVMLLDAGHVCQNLYLAAEALNLGTVAIAAYSQKKADELLKLNGNDEFTVYLAPVGRMKTEQDQV